MINKTTYITHEKPFKNNVYKNCHYILQKCVYPFCTKCDKYHQRKRGTLMHTIYNKRLGFVFVFLQKKIQNAGFHQYRQTFVIINICKRFPKSVLPKKVQT